MKRIVCITALLALAAPAAARAQADGDEAAVLATVQRLFDAMAARDGELARSLLTPEGRFHAVGPPVAGEWGMRSQSHEEFAEGLAEGDVALLERMWEPRVLVHGPIAAVWTPYDFHIDGRFSHCGIDAVHLVRTPDGWRISGIVYTVERERCAPSPLGPPER